MMRETSCLMRTWLCMWVYMESQDLTQSSCNKMLRCSSSGCEAPSVVSGVCGDCIVASFSAPEIISEKTRGEDARKGAAAA